VSQPESDLDTTAGPDPVLPTDPAELEAHIERTRARLDAAIRTPDGSLRVERLAAVAAAHAAMVSLVVWNRRRLRD
jgi:hypothetical protein